MSKSKIRVTLEITVDAKDPAYTAENLEFSIGIPSEDTLINVACTEAKVAVADLAKPKSTDKLSPAEFKALGLPGTDGFLKHWGGMAPFAAPLRWWKSHLEGYNQIHGGK